MSEDTTQLEIQQPNIAERVRAAMASGLSAEQGNQMFDFYLRVANHEAEIAFNKAMHRCQSAMKPIAANMENPQTRSKYASYDQIDRAIRPIYTGEGLSLSFGDGEPIASDFIRIICYVSHIDGHTRMYHKDMPVVTVGPQGKAVMTATHAHGSADQYAKRYLVKDIFNLAIGESDDDGNGGMEMNAVEEWKSKITAQETPETTMGVWTNALTYAKSMKPIDYRSMTIFTDARDERLKELRKAK